MTHSRPIVLLFSLLLLTAHAQQWNAPVEIPDLRGNGGTIGLFNDLVTVNGNPAIATLDDTHKMIRFIRAQDAAGTQWGIPVLVNMPAIDGSHLALAVVNGLPAIAYQSYPEQHLMIVRANDANGDTWGTPITIDASGDVGESASMAIVSGKPAIAYYDATANRLKYVHANDADGISWNTPVHPELIVGVIHRTELVVVNGNPAIGFGRGCCSRYIRAADPDGTAWNTGIGISTGVNNGTSASLAVVDGTPCMTYYNGDNGRLFFRRANNANGDSWASEVLVHGASGQVIGAYARLFAVDGSPAVAYQHVTNNDLYYVRATNATGTSWTGHVAIATTDNVGRDIAVGIVDGNPAVVCYDVTNTDLLFTRSANATGMGVGSWNAPVHIRSYPSVGAYTSQAIVDGFPALAYYDADNADLRYLRALDSTGTQWGASVTVDSITDCGPYCSLTLVNGRPAIAYYDEANNVRYVRANDAVGSAWGDPVSMDGSQSGPRGQGIALKVIAGRPAVAYQNNTNSNVRYVRANDADGTTWPHAGTTVGTSGSLNVEVALCEVQGLPAIVYYHAQFGNLVYERGGTVDFAGPGVIEVLVDVANNTGRHVSLAIVDGNPAISYQDITTNDLRYVRATTATGATWGSPVTVDANGGTYTSLAVVDAHPAIAYRTAQGLIGYVRANDAAGSEWSAPVVFPASSGPARYASLVVNGPYAGIAYFNERRQLPWFVGSGTCSLDVDVELAENILTASTEEASYRWLDCINDFAAIPGAVQQSYAAPTGTFAAEVTLGVCRDTSACVQVISTGILENTPHGVRVHMDAALDQIIVQTDGNTAIPMVTLFDARGRVVLRKAAGTRDPAVLDTSLLTPGLYLVEVAVGLDLRYVQRFLVGSD